MVGGSNFRGVTLIVSNFEVTVEKLVYGGDGLARLDGRVVFTPFVLPGERILARAEQEKPGLVRARTLEVLEAAPDRVAAPCPVYGRCGGCHYQHAPYEYQLAAKRAILVEALRRLGKIEPPEEIAVVAAEPFGYRNRVQLHVEEKRLGYREARSHKLVRRDRVPDGLAEDQSGDRGAGGDAARLALAAIHQVAGSVHGRDAGADQRAGDGSSGGAPLLRLVRAADSGSGGRRAGLPRRVPREQQFVLPGEPLPDRPAGGSGAGRRGGRDRARSVCGRGSAFACRWRGDSAR